MHAQSAMDQTSADDTQSQFLLLPPSPEISASQVTQMPQMPCMQPVIQTSTPVSFSPYEMLQMQYQQPTGHFNHCLSDSDVMLVAMQVQLLLTDDLDKLIKTKSDAVIAEYRESVENLKADYTQLRDSLNEAKAKLSAMMDDLEQYSKRSCVRIAGIAETTGENTDDTALGLPNRLNFDINPRDIDWSHRVGPARATAGGSSESKPRDIIV